MLLRPLEIAAHLLVVVEKEERMLVSLKSAQYAVKQVKFF